MSHELLVHVTTGEHASNDHERCGERCLYSDEAIKQLMVDAPLQSA